MLECHDDFLCRLEVIQRDDDDIRLGGANGTQHLRLTGIPEEDAVALLSLAPYDLGAAVDGNVRHVGFCQDFTDPSTDPAEAGQDNGRP